MDLLALWESVLEELKNGVNPQTFERWFGDCLPARLDDGTLVVEVPNVFVRNWIADHYANDIMRVLKGRIPSNTPSPYKSPWS